VFTVDRDNMSKSAKTRLLIAWAGTTPVGKATLGSVAALAVVAALFVALQGRGHITSVAKAARRALAEHRLEEARARIDEWSGLAPRDGEPAYWKALLEAEVDHPAEALDAIRSAGERGFPLERLLVLRAVIQSRVGRYDEAEPVLRNAFRASSEPRVQVAEALARIYLKKYQLAECARVLEVWMNLAPDSARPYLWRAEIDNRVNANSDILIRDYREVLDRDPTLSATRQALADKLREASLIDEAEAEYAKVLECDPKSVNGHAGTGQIALLKGDLQSAIRHFEEALALDPHQTVALRELGLIDLKYGRIARACQLFKTAVSLDPQDPALRYSYANALRMAGDKVHAAEETAAIERLRSEQKQITELREQLALRPNDLDLRSKVAKWLIDHDHDKEGLEWTRLILAGHPGHAPTCHLLIDYHTRKGNAGLANYYKASAEYGRVSSP
jgi:tetratricopeptide (TPR) repeat protein